MIAALIQRVNDPERNQLLQLYWNRAGVKRELASLKREHYELLAQLKRKEGEIFRAQSQLEGLERLMSDPTAAANAMVYFQLRHQWRIGRSKIEQFVRELKQQREGRERSKLRNMILAKRQRRLEAIHVKLDELLLERNEAIDECLRLEARLGELGLLERLSSGRPLRRGLETTARNRQLFEEQIDHLNGMAEKIQGEPLPESNDLTLESRRLINVAAIALAQHLVVHFAEHDLARLAREAMSCSVGDMRFGPRGDCDRMIALIRERIEDLKQDKRLADKVKRRADRLVNIVRYGHESDTVPLASSISPIERAPLSAPSGARRADDAPLDVNVFEDDYWDLSGLLN